MDNWPVRDNTLVPEADWLNKTINIATDCVFGEALTALRYPELEFVSVKAKQTYCEQTKPFLEDDRKSPSLSIQQDHDDLLDLAVVAATTAMRNKKSRQSALLERANRRQAVLDVAFDR